jgi:predicted RNase H-like HicB family nuclease
LMRFTAVITKEERWYVAHCIELGVVSQGKTIEEAQANLKAAVELHLEDFEEDEIPQNVREVLLYPH